MGWGINRERTQAQILARALRNINFIFSIHLSSYLGSTIYFSLNLDSRIILLSHALIFTIQSLQKHKVFDENSGNELFRPTTLDGLNFQRHSEPVFLLVHTLKSQPLPYKKKPALYDVSYNITRHDLQVSPPAVGAK